MTQDLTAQRAAVMPASLGEALPPSSVHGLDLRPSTPLEFSRAWLQKTADVRRRRADLHAAGGLDGATPQELARLGAALSGELRVPIIAVRYADVAAPFPASVLADRLFGPSVGDSVSFRDYWTEVSDGLIRVDGVVTSWVTLRKPARHYLRGEEYGWGRFGRIAEFRQQVLAAADAALDFGDFDNDGPDGIPNSGDDDGYVDFVIFLYATDCAGYALDGAIWPHRGSMAPFVTRARSANGGWIKISDYVVLPAQAPGGCEPAHVGVLAHETAHAFGMPDLYDYDGSSAGVGPWGLLGTGSHGSAHSPAHPSAWVKEQLGWSSVQWIREGEPVELDPMQRSNRILRYDVPDGSDRYLLLENRTHAGSDRDLPGEGLLVWGIDPERAELALWNTDERRPAVGLLQRDRTGSLVPAGGDHGGHPFPGRGPARAGGHRVAAGITATARAGGAVRVEVTPVPGISWARPSLHLATAAGGVAPARDVAVVVPAGRAGRGWHARTSDPWLRLYRGPSGVIVESDPAGLPPARYWGTVDLVDERTGALLDRLDVEFDVASAARPTIMAAEVPWAWGLAWSDGALIHPGAGWDLLGLRPRPRLLRVDPDGPFHRTVARLPLEALYAPVSDGAGGIYVLGSALGRNYVYHVDADGNAAVRGGALGTEPAYGLARLPDGGLLLATWGGRIQHIDTEGTVTPWVDLQQPIYQIAADADGVVYAAQLSGDVLRLDLEGFMESIPTGFERGRLVAIALSPDGRVFAAERGGEGRIIELSALGPRLVTRIQGGEFYGLAADDTFVYALELRHRHLVRVAVSGPEARPFATVEP